MDKLSIADPSEDHRPRAKRLIAADINLSSKEGQFLGGIAFVAYRLTEKQAKWLAILEQRHFGEAAQ